MGSVKLNRFLTVLNRKDKKNLLKELRNEFGIQRIDGDFVRNNQGRVYLVSPHIREVHWDKLRIDRAGIYIGKWLSDGFRPSMEGSQVIGQQATKHVIELNYQGVMNWLKGRNIETEDKSDGFYIVKYNEDFLGGGKLKNNTLLNGVSKSRKTTTLIL